MDKQNLDHLKEEYQTHHMSERQVTTMKESMRKAKMENKNKKRSVITKIGCTAAAAVAAFIILPNTSPTVAYAMEKIPLLGNLVDVVTFRDYKYESDRNNANVDVPKLVPENVTDTEQENTQLQENLKKSTDEINAEIEKITDRLVEEFKANLSDEGHQDISVTYDVINSTEHYFTLKLVAFQSAGSGYEQNFFYTIDLATGERMKLADLFADGADYITPISENIKEQMRAQMEADENVMYWLDNEDTPEWNFNAITADTSFYVNKDGNIVINFNEGDVAPMYMGVVEFTIPSETVAGILK